MIILCSAEWFTAANMSRYKFYHLNTDRQILIDLKQKG